MISSKTGAGGDSSELYDHTGEQLGAESLAAGKGRRVRVVPAIRCVWQLLCSVSSLGTGAASGCSLQSGCCRCPVPRLGQLVSTAVDAVTVMLPRHKAVSAIPVVMTGETRTRKPQHRARAGLGCCWGEQGGDFIIESENGLRWKESSKVI